MEKNRIQALLIEDNTVDVILLREALKKDALTAFELTTVERLGAALTLLQKRSFDVILLDLGLPDSQGMETFTRIHQAAPETPTVILSGLADESFALQAVYDGAQDYLVKGPEGFSSTARAIRYALKRQQAQVALIESEERYRGLFEHMAEGLAYCRMIFENGQPVDWEYLSVNDSFSKITGLQNAIGKRVSELIPNMIENDPEIFTIYGRVASTGIHEQFEIFTKSLGIWFSISTYSPQKDYFVAVFSNITERKRAENFLQESEKRFSTIFQSSPIGISLAIPSTGIIIDANDAFLSMWGYSRSEMIGHTSSELNLWKDTSARNKIIEDLYQTGSIKNQILPALKKSGEEMIVQYSVEILELAGEKYFLSNVEDVTERLRAEHELRQSNERFTELANNISDIFWISEPSTRKNLYISPAFDSIVGQSIKQVEQLPNGFLDVIVPEDRHILIEARENEDIGIKTEVQYRICRPDGSIRWMRDKSSPVFDENKKVIRVVGIVRDLTEKMEAEIQLRESEYRFRQLAENIKEAFWMFDTQQQKIVYVSTAYETIWGRSCKDLYDNHLNFIETIVPEDKWLMQNAIKDQADGKTTGAEYRIQRPDGTIHWIWDRSFPIFDDSGKLLRTTGVATDITESKKNHEELENLNHTLEQRVQQRTMEVQDLYNNAPNGYHSLDAYGTIVLINQTELNWLGYSREELVGIKTFRELLAPQSQITFDNNFPLFKSRGWLKDVQLDVVCKSGNIISVLLNATAVYDADNKFLNSRSTIVDITERKKAEDALRESEERLNFLLAKTPAIIFTSAFNDDMPITFISDSVRDILGHTPRQYLENEIFWINLIHPDDLPIAKNAFRSLMENGHAVWESRVKRADGAYHWISNGVNLLHDEKGQPAEIIGYSVDINEQKLAEEALHISEIKLRQSRDELSIANVALEKAARLKDEFLASMSHELRTPLTGILGLSEALRLKTYGELNDKQQFAIKNIEDSGRHLLELINDILDLSKIEAGKLDLQLSPCSIGDVCKASLQLTKGMAQQKNQRIHYSPPLQQINVNADARRLKQILVNLLSNAVKFTMVGGELGLEVQTSESEGKISLTVWDNGIGIKNEDMYKLFTPFSQIDSSLAREYSGTGLGLSLVRRLVELHNGGIELETTFGQGSRFTITLPWQPNIPGTLPRLGNEIEPDTELQANTVKFPRVLIVDDNEMVLQVISEFLEAKQFLVMKARTGIELLTYAAEYHPDIILVDIQMPGMDGLEVIRHIRSHEDKSISITPIIAVTALAMTGDRELCLQAGANQYMSKPVILKELVANILKEIGKK